MTKHEPRLGGRNLWPFIDHTVNMYHQSLEDAMLEMAYLIQEFIECDICFNHYGEYLDNYPPEINKTYDDWFTWWLRIRNLIKVANGKEEWTRQDYDEHLMTLP